MRCGWLGWVVLAGVGCGATAEVDEAAFAAAAPQTLAVLPLVLREDDPGERAALKVAALRTVLDQRLAARAYLKLDPEEVDRRLEEAGWDTAEAVLAAPAQELGRVLDVDLVVRGVVTSLSNLEGALLYRQVIEGELLLVDARGGRTLGRVEHTESDTGGLLLGYSQSVEAVQQTLDNSTDLGFLRLAERWVDQVLVVFPQPTVRPEVEQPVVASVEVEPPSGTLRPGDAVEVTVRAGAGLRAQVDVGRWRGLPLVEEAPGVYRGRFVVPPGISTEGHVHAVVRDAFGVSATVEAGALVVEGEAPGAPSGLRAEVGGGRVRLRWEASAGEVSAYTVYGLGEHNQPSWLVDAQGTAAEVAVGYGRYAVMARGPTGLGSALAEVVVEEQR